MCVCECVCVSVMGINSNNSPPPQELETKYTCMLNFWIQVIIFSRQASLARQAFLITPLHGARYKTEKNAYAKK